MRGRRPGIGLSQTPGYWNPPKPEPARVVSTPPAELHTYQCPNCQTVATSTVRTERGSDLRCNMCQSWMRFLFSEPITTDAQRALARRGLVFNPYLQSEK